VVSTPLKNISQDYSYQDMEKLKMFQNVPNHQPDDDYPFGFRGGVPESSDKSKCSLKRLFRALVLPSKSHCICLSWAGARYQWDGNV